MPIARRASILIFGGSLLTTSVGAQTAGKPENSAAREAFRAGERAFDKADYVTALEQFRRAFKESPNDAVHFNIGVCLERLGRYKEAEQEYRAAAASTELESAKRDRAKSEAERVHGRLGVLDADTKTGGGELWVDGASACTLPCKLELDPRTHPVVAKKSGAESSEQVEIKSGETTTVRFDLALPKTEPPKPKIESKPKSRRTAPSTSSSGPGVLTWIGGGVALVGIGGFVGFGLRAKKLESDYNAHPTADTRDQGLTMQTLTNVSIGVAAVGAALVVVDLLVLSKNRSPSTARSANGEFRF